MAEPNARFPSLPAKTLNVVLWGPPTGTPQEDIPVGCPSVRGVHMGPKGVNLLPNKFGRVSLRAEQLASPQELQNRPNFAKLTPWDPPGWGQISLFFRCESPGMIDLIYDVIYDVSNGF